MIAVVQTFHGYHAVKATPGRRGVAVCGTLGSVIWVRGDHHAVNCGRCLRILKGQRTKLQKETR